VFGRGPRAGRPAASCSKKNIKSKKSTLPHYKKKASILTPRNIGVQVSFSNSKAKQSLSTLNNRLNYFSAPIRSGLQDGLIIFLVQKANPVNTWYGFNNHKKSVVQASKKSKNKP
jgi:hypothetical protein